MKLAAVSDLVFKMRAGDERLVAEVVEAMTTNETFFFRDKTPFDHFRESVIPQLIKARAAKRSLRIWCAAASTGQEPYSLAMSIKETPALAGWRTEIVATDLSEDVLRKSQAGIYSQFEVQRGLPIQLLVKYFKQSGDVWQLNADVRSMVQFRKFNLLSEFASLGKFDIVFCRNVLIYFDQATNTKVFEKLASVTEPDGYLFLGAAETIVGLTDRYQVCPSRRGVYTKVDLMKRSFATVA